MAYTAAAIAAMNKRGQALLDPNKAKPATPTPATPTTTAGATTLARGGSRPGEYAPGAPYSTSGTYISSDGLGNQKVGGSSGGTTTSTPISEQEKPSWIGDGSGFGGGDTTDTTGYIDDLKQAQIDAQIAALNNSLNNSLSNLDTQQAAIQPYYYDKRNQAAARNDVAALNFAQRAAARGISGNAGSMPEIYRNASLMGQLGALDQSEAAANAQIERDRGLLRNNFEADIAAAKAGAEATALQNTINQMNTDRNFALSEADVTGTYKGSPTMEGRAQSIQNAMSQLELEAAQLQNSYLPETLKLEVEKLRQDVASGKIDVSKAQAQLARIKSGASSSGLSFNQALDAWNSGIDTPAIRSVLGI